MALSNWLPESYVAPIRKSWVLVAGHRMHCLTTGTGPDLILLHGLLGTASAWEPVLTGLATESTVHAIDALGIGESDRVPGMDATLRAQADRVVAFMDQAGMAGADFLATSHGGAVALALAANYPERVRNLVLHAPANPYCTLGVRLINFYLSRLGTWFAYRVPHLPRPMQALALGRMYGDPAKLREGALAKYIGSLRIPGTIAYVLSMLKTWKRDMRALEQQLREILPSRALLVWGDRDRAVSLSSGQRLQQCFRTAELVVLPGTGHLPYEECPEQLVGAVNGFLSRIRSAVKTGPRLVADPA